MQSVVQHWSGLGFAGRVAITVLTGVTWAVRSLQAILFELTLPCRGLDDGDMRLSLIDYLTSASASWW